MSNSVLPYVGARGAPHVGQALQLPHTWPHTFTALQVHASLLTLLKGPHYTSEELEAGPLPLRLRMTEDGLAAARATSPLLSETVSQLLYLLRVFSFS